MLPSKLQEFKGFHHMETSSKNAVTLFFPSKFLSYELKPFAHNIIFEMKKFRYKSLCFVQNGIQSEWRQLKKFSIDSFNLDVFQLLRRKLSKPSVRSYFSYWIYQYLIKCAEKDRSPIREDLPEELFTKRIPFLAEAAMTIMYLHNQILDQKFDVRGSKAITKNLMAANILKDCLYDYVDEYFDARSRQVVHSYLRMIFRCVDTGQKIEKEFGNYKAFQKNQELYSIDENLDEIIDLQPIQDVIDQVKQAVPDKAAFIQSYFTRIFLTCAALFKLFTEMILHLLDYWGPARRPILNFAGTHGVMRQIVNDNVDFVKGNNGTIGKKPNDVLSDLRNKTITLPLIYHLGRKQEEDLISLYLETGKRAYLKDPDLILKELINSRALPDAMKIGRKLTSSEGTRVYLRGDTATHEYLEDLSDIAFNNRFYHIIYKKRHQLKKRHPTVKKFEFDLLELSV